MLAIGLIALGMLAAPPKPAQTRELRVIQAVLHDRGESAPSIPPNRLYIGGELIYFSFRIAGYAVKNDRVDLRWLIYASDPDGRLLWEPVNGAINEEVSHNDENWLPKIAQTLPLPPQLKPGAYKLLIKVSDEHTQSSVELPVRFNVGGLALPEVGSFSILNPGFYRAAGDASPMAEAVYRQGEALLLRFQLAGFKQGERNRYEVEYGLKVLRPSGKVMYEEPKAAAEAETPYYPKRIMNGAISLDLSTGLTPGVYSIVITARDTLGQAQAEATLSFRVEK
jgi:hypothetical protein